MPQDAENPAADDLTTNHGDDVDMGETATAEAELVEVGDSMELPFAEEETPVDDVRPTFLSHLTSPIVTLAIGEEATTLSAHQSLLVQSPHFATLCSEFLDDGSVCDTSR
jgi:hypothetical protein